MDKPVLDIKLEDLVKLIPEENLFPGVDLNGKGLDEIERTIWLKTTYLSVENRASVAELIYNYRQQFEPEWLTESTEVLVGIYKLIADIELKLWNKSPTTRKSNKSWTAKEIYFLRAAIVKPSIDPLRQDLLLPLMDLISRIRNLGMTQQYIDIYRKNTDTLETFGINAIPTEA
ncbi:MAG: hypothetical protein ACMG57_05985 [Candidatus Dojkabacteria bacterium]